MGKKSKSKSDDNIRKVSITEHPSKHKKDKEEDPIEEVEDTEETDTTEEEDTETSEEESSDSASEEDSDEDDDVSMNTEEILENDPLYFVLSKLFISAKKRSIADILEDIAEKLATLQSKA